MTAPGNRVSTAADFANLAVYERDGPRGKVARIVFANLEYDDSWRADAWAFAVLVGLLIFIAGMVGLPHLESFTGEMYMVFWVVGLPALVILFQQAKLPWKIRRIIELDYGHDALRVLRNGRVENQRQLSRMVNLTVEDHPEAEFERLARQEKGERKPSRKEQQHCLFGWFGAGGAEKVMLLARAEWPSNHSLFEVRQAIVWALARGDSRRPETAAAPMAEGGGINPPLD